MTIGHFIWTDLSTYNLRWAKRDYSKLFGWSFDWKWQYSFATLNHKTVAAAFPMPKRLAKINMPSFWMSYVHVESVEACVAKAEQHEGAIIEVKPEGFGKDAKVALIRDPSGAGFTVYEGPEIETPQRGHGTLLQRYHHLPDIKLIEAFYVDLFGWRFEKASDHPWPTYEIKHADGTIVALAEEVPETIRGKFRYWMPCFRVQSEPDFHKALKSVGGTISRPLSDQRSIIQDRQQAHFMIEIEGPL